MATLEQFNDDEEELLQDMMSANSFVFSQEGDDDDQYIQQQNDDDNEEDSYDDNYERKKIEMQEPNYEQNYITPRVANNDNNNINNNDNESTEDEEEDSSSMTDLDENNNIDLNNRANNNKNNKYRYKPIASNYYPNEIEKLTERKRGHHTKLDRYISPWTLQYIGDHEIFDKAGRYPQWINYKYESDNTMNMLTLIFIIMILASIHVSFTSLVLIC